MDVDLKVRAYQNIEAKLLKSQQIVEEKNLAIKDQDQKMGQLMLI